MRCPPARKRNENCTLALILSSSPLSANPANQRGFGVLCAHVFSKYEGNMKKTPKKPTTSPMDFIRTLGFADLQLKPNAWVYASSSLRTPEASLFQNLGPTVEKNISRTVFYVRGHCCSERKRAIKTLQWMRQQRSFLPGRGSHGEKYRFWGQYKNANRSNRYQ